MQHEARLTLPTVPVFCGSYPSIDFFSHPVTMKPSIVVALAQMGCPKVST